MSKGMMKAAVLHAVGDLRYEMVQIPDIKLGEVLVKIMACGVCGSDIPRVFEKGTYHFPTIPGHECSGLIVKANDGDKELIGKKVAVFPLLPCRKCSACEIGDYANCNNYDYYGSRRDGGFAEYIAVDRRNLIVLDDGISYAAASLCEPGAVARSAIRKLSVKLGELIVIYGAGPIGLIAAQWARSAGASCVRVVDISEKKLEFASRFGFLPYSEEKDGKADAIVEGTGVSVALNNAINALKPHGRIVLLGNPVNDITIKQSTYSQILRKEIKLTGTWNSSYNQVVNDWEKTALSMADGTIEYESLITHRFPLSECVGALQMMRDKKEFFTKVTFINE